MCNFFAGGEFDRLLMAARGDPKLNPAANEARGRLLEAYRGKLLQVARRECSSRVHSKVSPEDVVQDTFAEASDQIRRLVDLTESGFSAWLHKILRNNIKDIQRQFKAECRNLDNELELRSTIAGLVSGRENTPSANAAGNEHDDFVKACLALLDPIDRSILELRLKGLRFVQICKLLPISLRPDAARKRFDRAINKLSELFGQELTG